LCSPPQTAQRTSEEDRGKAATRLSSERVLGTEPGELADQHGADRLALDFAAAKRREQQFERTLGLPGVDRRKRFGELSAGLQRDTRAQPVGLEANRYSVEKRQGFVELAAGDQQSCERHRSVRPGRGELERLPQRGLIAHGDQRIRLGGNERVEERLDGGPWLRADELRDHLTVAKCFDCRNSLDPHRPRQARVGIGIDLREDHLAFARGGLGLEQRPELPTGPAPGGPEVDDDRRAARPLDHLAVEVCFVDVDGGHPHSLRSPTMRRVIEGNAGLLGVDDVGEQSTTAIVGLHGLTATRRYVFMGSRALERAGHRVVLYDARAHGASAPPADGVYSYSTLADDLAAVLDTLGIERAVLVGASMGAHTAVHFALGNPNRVAALVLITPAYDPERFGGDFERWDSLARGLREGGIDGFVDAYDFERLPEAWRKTIATVVAQRLALHEHPLAVADAIAAVPRSRPFASFAELTAISAPTLVVASRDEADPDHPYATAEAYAGAIDGAELVVEEQGRSPLAWQGGQLSRLVAALAERAGAA